MACAVVVASVSGCAKARAASVPDGPPLQMPQPPEHVLAPGELPPVVETAHEPDAPAPPVAAAPRTPA
ncbi:MAG: hypothetical protein HY824_12870, partial [Acidobacteria bacterium]|nr:hypothetical protein [Acidobacteriota bacterium]